MSSSKFKPIGSLIEKTLIRFDLYDGYLLAAFRKHKKQIFGNNFGSHFEPISFEKGRLVIRVDSAEWRHEAELNQEELLQRVNQYSNHSVKQIFFI
ncbi:MAG: DUF721 domain-containing protein [bacterium]|nr:DUF721 domain-containing protein [bacterium]